MTSNFTRCFEFCVVAEIGGDSENGGYTNDPLDPGGETKWGISKRAHPSLDIKNLTREAAEKIYKHDYWDRVRGDELPLPIALVLFEQAVNQKGSSIGAVKNLQRTLKVLPDGVFGPDTMNAVLARKDVSSLVLNLCKYRAEMYLTIDNAAEERFEKGWVWRLLTCQNTALGWLYSPP
jgi:lysozyme family protein